MVNGDQRSMLRRQDNKMVLIGFPLGLDSINKNKKSIDFYHFFFANKLLNNIRFHRCSIEEIPIFDFLDVRCRSVKQYQNLFRFCRCLTPFSKIISIMKFRKFWEKMHVFCNGFDFLLNMNIQ